ncbi:xylose isomerase-like protein [Chytriomyces sp. MP71]|nr:xylose isomerase-like protein [Chytriomyces sp. MP71]
MPPKAKRTKATAETDANNAADEKPARVSRARKTATVKKDPENEASDGKPPQKKKRADDDHDDTDGDSPTLPKKKAVKLGKKEYNLLENVAEAAVPHIGCRAQPRAKWCVTRQVLSTFPRLTTPEKRVGPHASAAKGVFNALTYTENVGGESFALFLGSQRKWDRPPLTQDVVDKFIALCAEKKFNKAHILPHGSYLINLGNPDVEKRAKSLEAFLEDVRRCERLGIELYNFHPGSTVGECTEKHSIGLIAEGINEAIRVIPTVVLVVENMAGQGNVIGGKFEHLKQIIDLVEDKTRVAVCLDTCHMFAAGYDIRTAEKFDRVMKEFDEVVGLKYLRAMHINDSMTDLGSGKDRHDYIGQGKIGIEAFRFLMNDDRFNGMPLILEVPVEPKTEHAIYTREIKLLYSLVKPTAEGD